MTAPALWLVITGMGVLTYALRLSMILLFDRVAMPQILRKALRFVPPAVLSAFVFPALLAPDAELHMSVDNARLMAGVLAALVAWRSKNVLLTIVVGMGMLWILRAIR